MLRLTLAAVAAVCLLPLAALAQDACKTRGELDAQRRLAIYADIQRRVVDLQPEIWGMLANRRWAMRDYVRGFVYCPVRLNGELDLHAMWIAAR